MKKEREDRIREISIENRKPKIKARGQLDKRLLTIVFILSLIGTIMVLSASTPMNMGNKENPYYFFIRHIIYLAISILIMVIVYKMNLDLIKKFIPLLIFLSYLSTFLVFTNTGVDVYGARRWISIGGFSIMPSDFLKIGAILMASLLISKFKDNLKSFFKFVLPYIFYVGLMVFPIFLQPDYSTLIVIGATLVGILYFAGTKLWHIGGIIIVGVGVLILGIIIEPYRFQRIISTFDPMSYRTNESWQLVNALYGVSSGGLTGVGFGKGISKQAYLSNQAHNDWIFSVLAEETGFIGSFIVIILFLFLIFRGFKIALESRDLFSKMLASGITLSLGIQAFINMGVAIGVVPSTGITLPFISYGGSALISSYIMVGLLLNISRKNTEKNWIYR